MADTLKARAADIKRRADEHHEALKVSNRALWDMIEAAREKLSASASGSGGQRKSRKQRKQRKNRKNRTYKK